MALHHAIVIIIGIKWQLEPKSKQNDIHDFETENLMMLF